MYLQTPYDFRTAVPFLLNLIGVVVAGITAAVVLLNGTLTVGTERFFFFSYVTLTLCLAAALSRAPRLSIAVFLWCCVEALLALSSTLLPRDMFTQPASPRATYHSLLQTTLRKNWHYRRRVDARNRSAYINRPMNWKKLNGEFEYSHNLLGLRGPELSARDYSRDMIFIYGGSTTYDITVSQGDTWAEQLQHALGGRFTVLNFGVPAHSTAEHLIHTVFYQEANGKRPVCAAYYVGWNDIHNAHIDDLDPGYADWHLLGVVREVRRPEAWAAKYSPFIRFANRLIVNRFDTVPELPTVGGENATEIPDPRLDGIFSSNVRTIAAINHSRGIRTVFIGQMLNIAYFEFYAR